jgi:ketosteroid isomerase-like protein
MAAPTSSCIWKDGGVGDDYEARARALWDAYARGDVDGVGALLDEQVVWRPIGGEVLRGRAEVTAYLRRNGEAISAVAHSFERAGDRLMVHGSLRRFRDGGFIDMQPSWVFHCRDGRVVSATGYESRAAARSALEDRGATPPGAAPRAARTSDARNPARPSP